MDTLGDGTASMPSRAIGVDSRGVAAAEGTASDGAGMGRAMGRGAMALPTTREAWARTFSSLRIYGYRLMFASMMASFLGMQMQQVARGYLTYELTGKASAVGIVSSAWGLPMLIFSLVGGLMADRLQKRNIMVVVDLFTGVMGITTGILVVTGVIQVWHLVVLGLLQGTTFAFKMPSRQAIIPELVGEKQLINAIALNSAGMSLTRTLGPMLAGLLIAVAFIDIGGVFFVIASCNLTSALILTRIRLANAGGKPRQVRRPMVTDLLSGLVYVKRSGILFMLIAMGFILILFGSPYQMLMPVFAGKVYDVGPQGLGMLYTVTGAGALVGSIWIASLAEAGQRGRLQLVLGVVFGISLLFFALTDNFWLALVLLIPVGLLSQAVQTLNNSLVMSHTDHEIRGRVMSVYMMTFSLTPLAVLPMGFLADGIGVDMVTLASAVAVSAIFALIYVFRPRYREIQ